MNDIQIYDELALGMQALLGLDDLLSGCSNEINPTSISLLLAPICGRLQQVKNTMQAQRDAAFNLATINQVRIAA